MKNFLKEFKEFAVKGNIMDLAIGVVIGTAFSKIVNSLVTDIILPPIGLALRRIDFSNLYISLNREAYKSLAEAQAAGAPTLNYGLFLNNVLTFLITALAVFLFVRYLNVTRYIRRKADEKTEGIKREEEKKIETKTCPYCTSDIPANARRCPECTTFLDKSLDPERLLAQL